MPKTPTPPLSNKREKRPTMYQTKPQQQPKKANKNKEMGYQHCIFCALIVCVLSASPPSPDHPRLNHHSYCWLLPSHSSNGHTQITANLSPTPPLPTQRLIIMLITPLPIPSITLWYHSPPTDPVYLFPSRPVCS